MANEFRFFIVGQDKSKDAADRVEARYAKLGKRLERIGGFMDRFGVRTPFGRFAKSFDDLGKGAGFAVQNLAASEEQIGGVAAIVGEATPIVGAFAIATMGAAIAGAKLGVEYGKAGAEIERTARRIGDSTTDLQRWRGAAAYAGVTAQSMTSALDGVGNQMQEAVRGNNQPLLALMSAWNIQVHHLKDGSVDTTQAMLDIARAMDRIHGAQSKRKFAEMFGAADALPLLMQGSKAVADNMRRFDATGALRKDTAESERLAQSMTELGQRWSAVKNDIARPIEIPLAGEIDLLSRGLDRADHWLKAVETDVGRLFRACDSVEHVLENWAGLAARVSTSLTPPAWLGWISPSKADQAARRGVAHLFGDHSHDQAPAPRTASSGAGEDWWSGVKSWAGKTFEDFAGRIEHQESRGRQFDRAGAPLTSSAGAVGVMQLEPETAQKAAGRLGVPFDERRLRTDAGYNRMLGREELRFLLARYGGDMTLAAAAYNAGPGALEGHWNRRHTKWTEGWLKRFGDPRKGEITDAQFAAQIPYAETRQYVRAFVRSPPIEAEPKAQPHPAPRERLSPILVDRPLKAEPLGRQVVTVADIRGAIDLPTAPAARPAKAERPSPILVDRPMKGETPPAASGQAAPPAPAPLTAPARPSYAQAVAPRPIPPASAAVAPTPAADVDPNAVRFDPQTVKVDISLKGAPRGTVARVAGSPGVDTSVRIERALDLGTAA